MTASLFDTRSLPPGLLPPDHHHPGCPHRGCPTSTVITTCTVHGIRCRLRGLTTPAGDCACGCACATRCVPTGGHLTLTALHRLLAAAYHAAGNPGLAAMYRSVPAWRVIAARNAPVAATRWQLRTPATCSVPLPRTTTARTPAPPPKGTPPVRTLTTLLGLLSVAALTGATLLYTQTYSTYTWMWGLLLALGGGVGLVLTFFLALGVAANSNPLIPPGDTTHGGQHHRHR